MVSPFCTQCIIMQYLADILLTIIRGYDPESRSCSTQQMVRRQVTELASCDALKWNENRLDFLVFTRCTWTMHQGLWGIERTWTVLPVFVETSGRSILNRYGMHLSLCTKVISLATSSVGLARYHFRLRFASALQTRGSPACLVIGALFVFYSSTKLLHITRECGADAAIIYCRVILNPVLHHSGTRCGRCSPAHWTLWIRILYGKASSTRGRGSICGPKLHAMSHFRQHHRHRQPHQTLGSVAPPTAVARAQ